MCVALGSPRIFRNRSLLFAGALGAPLVVAGFLVAAPVRARAQWTQTAGPPGMTVNVLHQSGGSIYAGSESRGIFRSTNGAASWSAANAGIESAVIYAIASKTGLLLAGALEGGAFRSTNAGASWSPSNVGIETQAVSSLLFANGFAFAGTIGNGTFRSSNDGVSWTQMNAGMGNASVRAMFQSGGAILAATDNDVHRSTDNGATWFQTPGAEFRFVYAFMELAGVVYAGTLEGILRSTDNGASWTYVFAEEFPPLRTITSLAVIGGTLYAGTDGAGVWRTNDGGTTWARANTGISTKAIDALLVDGTNLIAGTSDVGILISTNGGMTWTTSVAGLPPASTLDSALDIGSSILVGTHGDGVYRTTDDGASWLKIDTSNTTLANSNVFALASSGTAILAGTTYTGLFRSTNDGATWAQVTSGLPGGDLFVFSLASSGATVVAGTSEGIFRSTDSGASWGPTNVNFGTVFAVAASGTRAYAAVTAGSFMTTGIYRSTNSGLSWIYTGVGGASNFVTMTASGTTALVGDLIDGLFRSTDAGVSWSSVVGIPIDTGVFALASVGSDFYAGTEGEAAGVYRSTNGGSIWLPDNAGLESNTDVQAIAANSQFLFAGTFQKAVWRRPLAATGVDLADVGESRLGAPDGSDGAAIHLTQNAPNPFRGSTAISYRVAGGEPAELTVFDTSGRVVARRLLGAVAGDARFVFHAEGLPAGAYLYRIDAGTHSATRKMTILR